MGNKRSSVAKSLQMASGAAVLAPSPSTGRRATGNPSGSDGWDEEARCCTRRRPLKALARRSDNSQPPATCNRAGCERAERGWTGAGLQADVTPGCPPERPKSQAHRVCSSCCCRGGPHAGLGHHADSCSAERWAHGCEWRFALRDTGTLGELRLRLADLELSLCTARHCTVQASFKSYGVAESAPSMMSEVVFSRSRLRRLSSTAAVPRARQLTL